MRLVLAVAALSAASTGVSAEQGAVAEPNDRLTAAIERALAENPGILEMEQRIEAARARIPQARSLPEPMLTVGAINVPLPSLSFHQDEMTMKMVSIEQEIPGADKRSTAEAAGSRIRIGSRRFIECEGIRDESQPRGSATRRRAEKDEERSDCSRVTQDADGFRPNGAQLDSPGQAQRRPG